MSMCKDLRQCNFRAEYTFPETMRTTDEVMRYARTTLPSLLAVVFVKKSSAAVEILLAQDKSSLEVKRSEVREFLLKVFPTSAKRRLSVSGGEKGRKVGAAIVSPPTASLTSTGATSGSQRSNDRLMVSAADAPAIAAGACYHLQLEISILDQIKGRKAKQIQDIVNKRLERQLSMIASRKPIPVACIDLPLQIIQEICAGTNWEGGSIASPTQKHLRFKDEILLLASFLKKQLQRKMSMVILWSTRDSLWTLLV